MFSGSLIIINVFTENRVGKKSRHGDTKMAEKCLLHGPKILQPMSHDAGHMM